ncbi:MAG TPA: flagellar export chaperone FliS [Planctomycetota bacterium]|nr:flagellar export chaperone FliS [Planctomycetota bacterium]
MTRAVETHPYRKTQILTASPAELMLLLYNAAICYCEQAKGRLDAGGFEAAHDWLVKAENVVLELSAGLRRDAYPELVDNLSRLFQFVFYRLFEANTSRNRQCVEEAISVLTLLRDAWVEGIANASAYVAPTGSAGASGSVELSA